MQTWRRRSSPRNAVLALVLVLVVVAASLGNAAADDEIEVEHVYDASLAELTLFTEPVVFDGSAHIRFPNWMPENSTGLEISFWVWIDALSTRSDQWVAILHRGAEAFDRAPAVFLPPSAVPAAIHASVATSAENNSVVDAPGPVPLHTWTHVTVRWRDSSLELCVSGHECVASVSPAPYRYNSTDPLYVGGSPWHPGWQGALAQLQLRALRSNHTPSSGDTDLAAPSTPLAPPFELVPHAATSPEPNRTLVDYGRRWLYGVPLRDDEQEAVAALAGTAAAAGTGAAAPQPAADYALGMRAAVGANYTEACTRLQRAASHVPDACFALATLASAGLCGQASDERRWLLGGARSGHGPSALALAVWTEREPAAADARGYVTVHYWQMAAKDAMAQRHALVESIQLSEDTAALALGQRGDDDHLVNLERDRAERFGDTDAMLRLGNMYYYGTNGVQADYARAYRYYQQAADAGHAGGMAAVGKLYAKGEGVPQDNATSLRYFEQAAEKDNIDGLNGLGFVYYRGVGVTQNYTAALVYFERAAKLGSGDGMYNAGQMYLSGTGVPVNMTRGAEWLRRAAAIGHRPSVYQMGFVSLLGWGVPVSLQDAAVYFARTAYASEWNSELFKRAHTCFLDGAYDAAYLGYEALALMGYHVAAYNAAWLLYTGRARARPAADARAAALLQAHAEHDGSDPEALVLLARLLEAGRGVARNATLAARWYQHAADRGSAEGAFEFALHALRGTHVDGAEPAPDVPLARRYLAQLAAHRTGPWLLGEVMLLLLAVRHWWNEPSAVRALLRTLSARLVDVSATATLLAVLVALRLWWARPR